MLHVAWRDVRWPAPVCVRVCKRARAVVANARNIGIHCGGQAKPRTGSCDLELREKSTAIKEYFRQKWQLGLLARPVGRVEGTAGGWMKAAHCDFSPNQGAPDS